MKHGIHFDEAKTIFNDAMSLTIVDNNHSQFEDRWLELGLSNSGRLLSVWYTERGGTIRIIGSRIASRVEQKAYFDAKS